MITRQEIIKELKKYFDIREFVCPHTFAAFSERSWQFLDTEILHTVLILRMEILKVPMICNDYMFKGRFDERGLRCNICDTVKGKTEDNQIYLSAHCNGKGMDFVFPFKSGMTAEKAHQLIKKNANLLPYNVRIEKEVSWLHIDCFDTGQKVYEFNG